MSMKEIEAQISSLIRKRMTGARPVGLIKCDVGEGNTSFTGEVETGVFRRKKEDAHGFIFGSDERSSFFDLLLQLREASRSLPDGPVYHCNIHIKNAEIRFQYFWENAPFASIKELALNVHGHVPDFVLKRRFDRSMVRDLSDLEVNNCLLLYVPTRVAKRLPVTDALTEVYATLEWQSDVNNGAMDQYFARAQDTMTCWKRSALYGATYRGLLRIRHEAAANLFSESIALYAHFHARVENARIELDIPAVPKQERSDIMSRYYEIEPSVTAARVRYIREHIVELEQG